MQSKQTVLKYNDTIPYANTIAIMEDFVTLIMHV